MVSRNVLLVVLFLLATVYFSFVLLLSAVLTVNHDRARFNKLIVRVVRRLRRFRGLDLVDCAAQYCQSGVTGGIETLSESVKALVSYLFDSTVTFLSLIIL